MVSPGQGVGNVTPDRTRSYPWNTPSHQVSWQDQGPSQPPLPSSVSSECCESTALGSMMLEFLPPLPFHWLFFCNWAHFPGLGFCTPLLPASWCTQASAIASVRLMVKSAVLSMTTSHAWVSWLSSWELSLTSISSSFARGYQGPATFPSIASSKIFLPWATPNCLSTCTQPSGQFQINSHRTSNVHQLPSNKQGAKK